jgi:RsiW-degrading membrane proteinase PrsW (M82 family)
MMTLLAILIAVGIPAAFLMLIYTLDLYASRSFRLVVLCFLWGALGAFGIAYVLNSVIAPPLAGVLNMSSTFLMVVAVAPVVEELAKSLSLIYVSRRSEFTYFVDGAIYGFAAGIGFSIIENFLYISRTPEMGAGLALVRGFSTCLMHGTAAGLVGVAVGRFRFQRRSGRGLALVGGWVAAIVLHAAFNRVAWEWSSGEMIGTVIAMGIGLSGVGLTAFFIALGLREQRQWLLETLDRQVGVTAAESRMVQAYGDLDEVLRPIFDQFPHEAENVEAFLLRQAQLGIKRKVRQKVDDPKLQEKLAQEIERLQAEMDEIRRETGVYVMSYVRSVFPDDALPIWSRLELLAAQSGPADLQRWADMLTDRSRKASERSIFASIQDR